MSWARTVLDPITRTASAHASEALNCTAAPVLSVPEERGRTHFWQRLSLSQRAAPHNDRQTASARDGWWHQARERRRPPAPAAAATQVWPDRGQVGPECRVAYLKPELSVLLKSAKDL